MSDPLLTYIATVIVIVAIGGCAILFAMMPPVSAVEWQQVILEQHRRFQSQHAPPPDSTDPNYVPE